MALFGKFTINNADFSPLLMYGVGTFMAFSGDAKYRNRGGCIALPDKGPLPPGRYLIVDRPAGGTGSRMRTSAIDSWNSVSGAPSDHTQWFALDRADGQLDDYTWINHVKRGNFRLHPVGGQGLSLGCITLQHSSDFAVLRNALLATNKVVLGKGIVTYGEIEVVAYESDCPVG
ncbi:DUF2778 domain-containing protein [Cronobacter turicensis]|nr:DUF2778 domain-containing protein [Cronobacter turicensis]ELQ6076413.1 DUF2778 domain-containing protein [Cronobacter turicensis]ELQ6183399.1 DUF2778 domain-containing protein [Cronobacter turicensis]ELQ6232686.1 DUF2778 domain-containing protein [Cronobacter turicensis]ELQ6236849.1 DUF2778 domain-containing protein [Cronobacter turicensis]